MAGQNIGFLNFGIDGDDKEIKKKLEALNKDAVTLESILGNIKIGTKVNGLSKDIQKAQLDTDKLAISTNKVARSEEELNNARRRGITLEEQATNAKKQGLNLEARLVNEKKRSVILDNQSKQSAEATALAAQRRVNAEIDAINKKARAQQQEMINSAKLEGINKRNALIGTKSIQDVNSELSKQGNIIDSLTKRAAAYFSVYKVAQFAKEIVTVRGEFEGLEVAFETMLGTADKSAKMMSEITTMALQTPYTVKDVADNVKQLIAMGIEAENAMSTMKALGDVAAGLSVPLWRIAINYGQVATLGRLQQREIRDFAMAGVPIMDALAEVLGKTKTEITAMVSAGQVGFPAVEEAFRRMAGEGGKFHNMMQKRNATMLGQMNRLQDQVQLMMNEIGKSNEGVIYSTIGGLSTLVENYDKVGKIVLTLVGAYGAYKASLIAIKAIESVRLAIMVTQLTATGALTASQTALTISTNALSYAFSGLNKVVSKNPFILIGAQIALMAVDMKAMTDSTEALTDANKRLDETIKDIDRSTASEMVALGNYVKRLHEVNESSDEFIKLRDEFINKYSVYNKNLKNEITTVSDVAVAYDKLEEAIRKSNAARRFDSLKTEEQKNIENKEIEVFTDVYSKLKERTKNNKEASSIYAEFYKAMFSDAPYEMLRELESKYKMSVGIILRSGYNDIIKYRDASKKIVDDFREIYQIETTPPIDETKKESEEIRDFSKQVEDAKKEVERLRKEKEALGKGLIPDDWAKDNKGKEFDFIKGIEDKTKELNDAEERLNTLLFGSKKGKKEPKETKDPEITKLENRIDLLKKAKSEYEKLSKVMDKDKAFAEISKNPAFKGISQTYLSGDGFIQSIDAIIEQVSKLKSSDKKDKLLVDLFSLKTDTAGQIVKDASSAIERELSKYKDKYNLYETLLGITGNEEQAKKLVFGDVSGVIESYKDRLKKAIETSTDKDFKKKMQDELFSFENAESEEFLKEMAKMLEKYQSYEDKITKIKNDGINERQKITDKVESGNIDGATGEDLITASINKQKELISELENESLKLTPFYQRLFGDIGSYGVRALRSIISETERLIEATKTAEKNSIGAYRVNIDGKETSVSESDLAKMTKQLGKLKKEVSKSNPFSELADAYENYKGVISSEGSSVNDEELALSELGVAAEKAGAMVKSLSSDFAGMFDALGNEDLADTIGLVGDLTNSVAQIGSGIATNNPVSVIQGIVGGITSIANFHDKKLDKAIQRSQLEVKKLQNSYAELSRIIDRQLGAVSESQAKRMVENQEKQLKELEKQRQAELDKKKTDHSVVADLDGQIAEAKDQLRYFYEDLAGDQWGISVKDWSQQIADSLVDAFSKGEDAVKAFDGTVASIMRNVVSNMIKLDVIEPAMEKLRKSLFGDDGKGGLLGKGTTNLSNSDAASIVNELSGLRDSIGEGKQIWDYLNEAAKQAGIDLSEAGSSAKDTLSKGIQAVTEDTANLLASYINAIRSDVSITKEQIIAMTEYSRLNNSTLGDMLLVLKSIEVNTFNTAGSTLKNADLAEKTYELLKAATTIGSTTRLNIQ